ncbi:MAG: antibiotic biosynthesis monooxygenase family protein [Vitreimonas sp.]
MNFYEVAPEKQDELVRLLGEATEKVMRHMAGFVSVNIHRSLDGTQVVNYAQWASRDDFTRMLESPQAQGQMNQFAALAKTVSPALYQVSSVLAK